MMPALELRASAIPGGLVMYAERDETWTVRYRPSRRIAEFWRQRLAYEAAKQMFDRIAASSQESAQWQPYLDERAA